MKIVFAGIIARYPFGGVAWCSLMYLLGLRALGHEVFYVEDTGECVYDPEQNTIAEDPAYGLRHLDATLSPHGFGQSWAFVNYDGRYFGCDQQAVRHRCRDADLFINLSGGTWFWRDEYAAIPRKVFVDSDPAFTQLAIAKGVEWYVGFFRGFDALFTFGANIGTPRCAVPTGEFTWHHTWQPVVMDQWTPAGAPRDRRFTTVMTWQIKSFADIGGNKDQQFVRFIDLPARAGDRFELAVNGPHDLLQAHGWRTVRAMDHSRTANGYREFIRSSYAEFGVAKHTYVDTSSGWFSDRTACYLAAGRPAVVQDTGWSGHVPAGEGLLAFEDVDEAVEGIASVDAGYETHARRAREIAGDCFDAHVVLPALLARAMS